MTIRKASMKGGRNDRPTPRPLSIAEIVAAAAVDLKVDQHVSARSLVGALRAGQYALAVSRAGSISSQLYGDSREHFAMNQLAYLVKKYPDFKDPLLDPERKAFKKFRASEHRCRRYNQLFELLSRGDCRWRLHPVYSRLIPALRSQIRSLIGVRPDLHKIYEGCDFGPGASVGVHGQATHTARKLGVESITVTPACAPYFFGAVWAHAQYRSMFLEKGPSGIDCVDADHFRAALSSRLEYVPYNIISFVPKTADAHRTIAVEPLGNSFVQKGVDKYLRRRLTHWGINLRDQERNQFLALLGSQGGFNPFSTIDLSAASDSISTGLARMLLPRAWFELLNDLRSPTYKIVGSDEVVKYDKFTTMGNGFCFPLQSLIFAAVVRTVYAETGDSTYAVYGDDIIVRQSSALLVIEYLRALGFRTNVDKTFVFGPFRESCGADFFEGVAVRPYVLDETPKKSWEYIKLFNGVAEKLGPLSRAASLIHDSIPERDRLYRPVPGNADAAMTVPFDIFMTGKSIRWSRRFHCWEWEEFISLPVADEEYQENEPDVDMYAILRGAQQVNCWGKPEYALRRSTRTVRRWCLPDEDD